MKSKTKALLFIHVAVFLWGFTGILGKLIPYNAYQLVWWRLLLCSIALLPFTLKGVLLGIQNHLKSVGIAALVGVLLALHWICFYQSIKCANVSVGVVCLSATAFFTVFFEYALNRISISIQKLFLSLLSIIGIYLMFTLEPQYRWGILIGIIAAILNAVVPILNKPVISLLKPLPTLFIELVVGFGVLSVIVLWTKCKVSVHIQTFTSPAFVYLLILSLLCTIIPMYLAYDALQHIEPFTENIIINLEPIYTVVFAFWLFEEGAELSGGFYIGLGLILCSVGLQTFYDYRKKYTVKK